jgi:hypothetical protein
MQFPRPQRKPTQVPLRSQSQLSILLGASASAPTPSQLAVPDGVQPYEVELVNNMVVHFASLHTAFAEERTHLLREIEARDEQLEDLQNQLQSMIPQHESTSHHMYVLSLPSANASNPLIYNVQRHPSNPLPSSQIQHPVHDMSPERRQRPRSRDSVVKGHSGFSDLIRPPPPSPPAHVPRNLQPVGRPYSTLNRNYYVPPGGYHAAPTTYGGYPYGEYSVDNGYHGVHDNSGTINYGHLPQPDQASLLPPAPFLTRTSNPRQTSLPQRNDDINRKVHEPSKGSDEVQGTKSTEDEVIEADETRDKVGVDKTDAEKTVSEEMTDKVMEEGIVEEPGVIVEEPEVIVRNVQEEAILQEVFEDMTVKVSDDRATESGVGNDMAGMGENVHGLTNTEHQLPTTTVSVPVKGTLENHVGVIPETPLLDSPSRRPVWSAGLDAIAARKREKAMANARKVEVLRKAKQPQCSKSPETLQDDSVEMRDATPQVQSLPPAKFNAINSPEQPPSPSIAQVERDIFGPGGILDQSRDVEFYALFRNQDSDDSL